MLSADDIHFLWQIEVHCQRCMRAAKFFDCASGTNKTLWTFTQNCYGEIAITYWCKVFGAKSEPTHFSKLFEGRTFATGTGGAISINNVRQRLQSAVGMSEGQYHQFWNEVKDARDKVFVHNEFTAQPRPTFPDIEKLAVVTAEMRTIIGEIVAGEQCQDSDYLTHFRYFMEDRPNRVFLRQITTDGNLLAAAIGKATWNEKQV